MINIRYAPDHYKPKYKTEQNPVPKPNKSSPVPDQPESQSKTQIQPEIASQQPPTRSGNATNVSLPSLFNCQKIKNKKNSNPKNKTTGPNPPVAKRSRLAKHENLNKPSTRPVSQLLCASTGTVNATSQTIHLTKNPGFSLAFHITKISTRQKSSFLRRSNSAMLLPHGKT